MNIGLPLDIPGVQWGEHLAHDIEELILAVLLVVCSKCIVRLIWQECTKRQIGRLFKATEKTFILGCGLL